MQLERSESGANEVAALPRDHARHSGPTAKQRQAYVTAVERHYARIYGFLFHMARDAAAAEDLTQETFASAWQNLNRFEGRSSLQSWLYSIALNAYRAHARSRKPEAVPIDEQTLDAVSAAPAGLDLFDGDELQEKAQAAVAELPDIYREVIVLHYYQGLKYREIAALLDLPLGTVQGRSHVAFEKLRSSLGAKA